MQLEVPMRAALRLGYLPVAGTWAWRVELHHIVWFPFSANGSPRYLQFDDVACWRHSSCLH